MLAKRLGRTPNIHKDCELVNTKLGEYTEIGMFNFLENVTMGDYSYTCQFCIIQNADIGKFSNIAAMARIGPTNHPVQRASLHHFTYRRAMYGFSNEDDAEFFKDRASKRICIGHDTWIGHGVVIMPGVRIGNGAVVGSGAVVTKDVEPYGIAVGVPARIIKKRFEPEVVQKLQSICWWDWGHETIRQRLDDFMLDINEFVSRYYQNDNS